MMKVRFVRRALAAMTLGVLVTGLAPQAAGAAEGSSYLATLVQGRAFGARAAVDPLIGPDVALGPIAQQTLTCAAAGPPVVKNNTVGADVVVPGLLPVHVAVVGVTTNTGSVTRAVEGVDVYETSTVASLSLVDGLVQATGIEARSHSRLDDTGYNHFSTVDDHPGGEDGSTGVTLASLSIAGVPVDADLLTPDANTEIPLPGVGHIVLNEQVSTGVKLPTAAGPKMHSALRVNAIHLYLDAPLAGEVVVGFARTQLTGVPASLYGNAFTSSAKISSVLNSGRSAVIPMPCVGTDGVVEDVTAAGVDQPGVLTVGAAINTVQGDIDAGYGETTSTVGAGTALDGAVTFDAINVTARVDFDGESSVVATSDVDFVNLAVLGTPVAVDVPPGTVIDLPGIGTVKLGAAFCKSDGGPPACEGVNTAEVSVTAIVISVTNPTNVLGLPVGSVIRIASATVGVRQ